MATKVDQNAIRMAEVFKIRLQIKDSEKETYTKEELLDFLDEEAKRIDAAEE